MTKIERRRTTVPLYQGHYEAQLAELIDKVMAAERAEESGGARRFAGKSESMALAKQYDDLVTEAEDNAVRVTLWAIRYDQFGQLADDHPPRDDHAEDKLRGVNLKTFPMQLLLASLAPPDVDVDVVEDLIVAGKMVLKDLGHISQLHYVKLERAAWDVNVGDDALPKSSLVSLLRQQRDGDSSQPEDGE